VPVLRIKARVGGGRDKADYWGLVFSRLQWAWKTSFRTLLLLRSAKEDRSRSHRGMESKSGKGEAMTCLEHTLIVISILLVVWMIFG